MKKLYTLLTAVILTISAFAQAPEKMSYQSVVRDASNALVTNQAVGMQLSILQGTVGGTAVYVETQSPTTNSNGLVSLELGSGTVVNGDFTAIDWSLGPYFIKTETDPLGGTTYTITGTSQLMSVPYALYAKTSGNGDGVDGINGADGADGLDGAVGPQGPAGDGVAQNLTISGDTLFISSGNYIVIPGLSLVNALIIEGCIDSAAFNFDPLANTDDGSCIACVNGCTDAVGLNYDALATCDDGSCIGIGSPYQGGIIFYLDGNGGGLIAAPTDQSTGAEWGCSGIAIPGADGTAIGTGSQNTVDIEAGCATAGTAADICANLTLGGYSDWFLPSKDELHEMYLNIGQGNALGNIGGFENFDYWSSEEAGLTVAWVRDFSNGGQGVNVKGSTYYVRAVRAFIGGCTDSAAPNYNPLADTDDGSCIAVVNGCTDSAAFNFDPLANTDDGSCIINGCTDSAAFNFDPLANTDDGSCIAVVNGCTDSAAFNFDPLANTDDGSCIAVVNGCTDSTAPNYNPLANTDDGLCLAVCSNPLIVAFTTSNYMGGNDEIVNGNPDFSYVALGADPVTVLFNAGLMEVDYDLIFISDENGTLLNSAPYHNVTGQAFSSNGSISIEFDTDFSLTSNLEWTAYCAVVNGCTDSTAPNYNPSSNTDDGSCIGIGATYQGGIIFYLDGNGGGLIAAPTDQSNAEWGCYSNYVGANGTAIGTGYQNTIDIVNANCSPYFSGNSIAADICANLTLGGYSDWFLPSKDELNEMYSNIGQGNALGLGNVGGFADSDSDYMSSTEIDAYNAWCQYFNNNGLQDYHDKIMTTYVRAVRAF